jgi:hypothetical protein
LTRLRSAGYGGQAGLDWLAGFPAQRKDGRKTSWAEKWILSDFSVPPCFRMHPVFDVSLSLHPFFNCSLDEFYSYYITSSIDF